MSFDSRAFYMASMVLLFMFRFGIIGFLKFRVDLQKIKKYNPATSFGVCWL